MLSILKALLGLNLTLLRNSLFHVRSRIGYKNAVPPRKQGNPFLVVFLLLSCLFQTFMWSHDLIDRVELRIYESAFTDQKLVSKSLLDVLENEKEEDIYTLFDNNRIRDEYNLEDLDMEYMQAHYAQHGRLGFYIEDDLREYQREGGISALGSYMLMLLCFVFVCLLCYSLSTYLLVIKQQSGKDDMLKYLPLQGAVVLLGSFFSRTVMRILCWFAVFPLMTVVFTSLGYSYVIAVPVSILFTLLFSAMISSIEIVLDTWLRYAAPKSVVNYAQKVFAVLGMIGINTLIVFFISHSLEQWIYDKVVYVFGENNFLGSLFAHEYNLIVILLAMLAVAIVMGVAGCLAAGKILDSGITYSLNEQSKRMKEHDSSEKSLWYFEKLALLRHRGIATQIIMLPLILIGFQLLINPKVTENVDFKTLCALGVGCGAYSSFLAISCIFTLEQKGLWIVQTLPCDISDYFNRRERLWRIVGIFVGGSIIVFGVFWQRAYAIDQLLLAILSLIGMWVVSRVVNGIIMGAPELNMGEETSNEFRPKAGKMCLAMLVAGSFISLLYQENLWGLCVVIFLCWLLGQSIWERQRVCYKYMFDPTERVPKEWSVATALWLVVAFFGFQSVGMLLFFSLPSPAWIILSSFIFGGLMTLGLSKLLDKKISQPLESIPKDELIWVKALCSTLGLTVVCLVIAQIWLSLLAYLKITIPESDIGLDQWQMLVLIVIAAPLLEEPVFRGRIYRVMQKTWSVKKSIMVSALLFAVVHPGYSFLPVFCLGLATAWLFQKTGRLCYSILLHALYNFGVVYFT